eukprot:TRINITY_DN12338_c0_g2_i1.p1 TRINITY_DN12338_c0_g2~~TRINITY_DN12338_c0_g2_i1.p1  ORF type:complete len:135 (+),score=4.14 TRINITY_DN12338_c0_g2_i1:66-470(+)
MTNSFGRVQFVEELVTILSVPLIKSMIDRVVHVLDLLRGRPLRCLTRPCLDLRRLSGATKSQIVLRLPMHQPTQQHPPRQALPQPSSRPMQPTSQEQPHIHRDRTAEGPRHGVGVRRGWHETSIDAALLQQGLD